MAMLQDLRPPIPNVNWLTFLSLVDLMMCSLRVIYESFAYPPHDEILYVLHYI